MPQTPTTEIDENTNEEWDAAPQTSEERDTHAQLVRHAARWLAGAGRCVLVLCEYRSHATREQPDAIGWRADGTSILVECKTSRADFKVDAKKPWRKGNRGMGQLRYFLTPSGLIKRDELPAGWGLITVSSSANGPRAVCAAVARATCDEKQEKCLLINANRRAADYRVEPFYAGEAVVTAKARTPRKRRKRRKRTVRVKL